MKSFDESNSQPPSPAPEPHRHWGDVANVESPRYSEVAETNPFPLPGTDEKDSTVTA